MSRIIFLETELSLISCYLRNIPIVVCILVFSVVLVKQSELYSSDCQALRH